ncbi:hypothetical protein BDA99DRAFT_508588 [Phascolomyces articulosus]|uniref:Oxidoreductase AflY n=1 Tax=Phascolomyces articulosus TaxID=60185 RepID=A0AAD5PE82_9FUNG|nr:hypothetical protein BDA99DRAFT_508588 [Phascolomyces articulosus]
MMNNLPAKVNNPSQNNVSHYSIRIPGTTPVDLSKHTLIDKNHREHDIFFNSSGFHNHLTHHYLAAYALGADMKRLQDIFYAHSSYMRPIPDAVGVLTRETYRNEISNRDAYTSYLNLFKDEIQQHGLVDTVRYWLFKDDMLAHTIGGAYHPLIHLGYALEFNLPNIGAEALAMAACTEPSPALVMEHVNDKTKEGLPLKEIKNGTKSVMELIQDIHKDTEFDGVVKFTDELKSVSVLNSPKSVAKLREYVAQWNFKDVESSMEELFISCILLLVGSGMRPQGIKLDFFLAHAVTSIHAIYTLLPYLTPIQAELILRGHLAESLMFYVARGRPSIQLDLISQYKSPQAVDGSKNPWLDVLSLALNAEESHCIKAVRAIATAQTAYGSPSFDDPHLLLKAAQVTVDVTGRSDQAGRAAGQVWNFAGIGFKEAWEDELNKSHI